MSEANVELHRLANEAFNTRDVEAYIAYCDPEIELHSAVTGPGSAVYYGHDGLRQWHRQFEDAFGEEIRVEPEVYYELADQTISLHWLHGRGKQSGADVRTQAADLCRWQNGLIVYRKGYVHREDAFRDLGVSEEALEPIRP